MATTRTNSMRLKGMHRENTIAGKSNMDANQLARSALHEIGNKVSCITLDNTKRRREDLVKKGTLRQRAAGAQKAPVKQESLVRPVTNAETKTNVPSSPMEVCAEPDFQINMENVIDIDADDHENPQLVSEYVNDIYSYLRGLEKSYSVDKNYLQGQEITGKMRAILTDWLCQVHHRFRLLQETLYLTVSILDRFLQVHPVSRSKLQLVGVTAMLIASKYEEMYAPEVSDFVYITDNAYTRADIRQMESVILKALDFRLGKPLCLHFLRRNSKAGQVDGNTHTLAKYLMELTIVEYDMVYYLPSQVAAAALCLSLRLLSGAEWNDTLAYYSTYSIKDLTDIMQRLAKLVLKAETSKLTAVRTKYQSSKFYKISTISELKGEELRRVAEC